MRTVCVVLVNRANYARVKSVLRAVDDHPDLRLRIVGGSSLLLERFGNAAEGVAADGFAIDARVNFVVEGQTPATMAVGAGLGIVELATVFENMAPDVVLVVADRYDALSAAVAAAYMNIPLAHLQGGEITGSIDESVRHAITRLAHLHFPATERSAERLIRMGEDPETVHCVGCPSIDVAVAALRTRDGLVRAVNRGYADPFDLERPYLLVLQHPVTTRCESAGDQMAETLAAVETLKMPTLLLTPNVDAGGRDMAEAVSRERSAGRLAHVRMFSHFSPENYVRLMAGAACCVGNSSSAIREGAFLGTPAVSIGDRQTGRERGENVLAVDYDRDAIAAAVREQIRRGRYPGQTLYGDGTAGRKIADILASTEFRLRKRLMF
jgi:UDP-hydrolysing UDP-N-acetyl-D-glucosamine 2-epimerase